MQCFHYLICKFLIWDLRCNDKWHPYLFYSIVFQILLHQLRSPSLTIVSNACGTLWNLSARCEQDQSALRDMGAVAMLKNLIHSRHKMISSGSSAALRNLLSSAPPEEQGENRIVIKERSASHGARPNVCKVFEK